MNSNHVHRVVFFFCMLYQGLYYLLSILDCMRKCLVISFKRSIYHVEVSGFVVRKTNEPDRCVMITSPYISLVHSSNVWG